MKPGATLLTVTPSSLRAPHRLRLRSELQTVRAIGRREL
jgi:hypothetical protein